jgi:putative NIF3 family GTP cyclohydrolase 1 type 2
VIRYAGPNKAEIKKVAVCGGSGFFLLPAAIAAGAEIFITGDVKYHEFFDAEDKIVLADIGHFESEQFTIDLLVEELKKKFTTFAVLKVNTNTNPVKYL